MHIFKYLCICIYICIYTHNTFKYLYICIYSCACTHNDLHIFSFIYRYMYLRICICNHLFPYFNLAPVVPFPFSFFFGSRQDQQYHAEINVSFVFLKSVTFGSFWLLCSKIYRVTYCLVYTYIYIYLYIYIPIYIYTYICIYIYSHIYISIDRYMCIYVCTCIYK